MSERKAINKYYPPDYDPSKIKKVRKNPNQIIKIRMMAPYSMRCLKCNEYIAERRSFNAKKEPTNEKYLNIKIIRFHIYCPRCNNVITFKTNPQTAGYLPENGAVRNFEPTIKKTSDAKVDETEDELFKRLEREEQENAQFQTLKEKRKKNPFWQSNDSNQNNDIMENLQDRLQQQMHQQQITEDLENLQEKHLNMINKGGREFLTDQAIEKLKQLQEPTFEKQHKLEQDKPVAPIIKSKILIKKKAPTNVSTNNVINGYSSSDDEE